MYWPQPLDHMDTQALEHLQTEKGMNSTHSVLYEKVNNVIPKQRIFYLTASSSQVQSLKDKAEIVF